MTQRRGDALFIPMSGLGPLALLGIALLVVGAFGDFQISERLYTPENMLGTVLAAYGEAPALLALVAAGTLAWIAEPPVHAIIRWLLLFVGALLILTGSVALVVRALDNWPLPLAVHIIIGIGLSALTIFLVTRAGKNAPWQIILVLGTALVVVVAAELVVVQALKDLWERPRMRMLVETKADFSPWWSPGYSEKDALIAQGVPDSEFASFPSSHTAHAMVAIMLAGFAMLREEIARYRWLLFWIGVVWALFVGLSRITIGAHFLADIGASILITIACIALVTVLAGTILRAGSLDRLAIPSPRAGQPAIDPTIIRHSSPAQIAR